MQRIVFRAFGSQITAVVDAGFATSATHTATTALAAVPLRAARVERALSRFRDDSELSRLNREGVVEDASRELLDALDTSLDVAHATGGLVTPAVHDALVAAGYASSFVEQRDLRRCLQRRDVGDWRDIVVDRGARRVRSPHALDVGGTVKGAFADDTAELLSAMGPALVEAGGDVAVSGPRSDGAPWIIDVEAPGAGDEVIAQIELSCGGVATSGWDHRRWPGGHHIIDPRTGLPAKTDVLRATVVAESALAAEVLAKLVVLLGVEQGLAFIDARASDVAALVMDDDDRLHRSRAFKRYVHRTRPDLAGRTA